MVEAAPAGAEVTIGATAAVSINTKPMAKKRRSRNDESMVPPLQSAREQHAEGLFVLVLLRLYVNTGHRELLIFKVLRDVEVRRCRTDLRMKPRWLPGWRRSVKFG